MKAQLTYQLFNYLLLILIISITSCQSNEQPSVSVSPIYSSGKIYIKYFDSIPIYWNNTPELDPKNMNEVLSIIEIYGITKIENQFWFSTNNNERHILKIHFTKDEKTEELIQFLTKLPQIEFTEKIPQVHQNGKSEENNFLLIGTNYSVF